MPVSTFVVGDVHGRRSQLRRLLDMLPRDPARDTLVLLGDLIDRGEDVPEVGRAAEQLGGEFIIVAGGRAYRVRP